MSIWTAAALCLVVYVLVTLDLPISTASSAVASDFPTSTALVAAASDAVGLDSTVSLYLAVSTASGVVA